MVQFVELMNKKEDRKVREVVFIKGETIRVYEPSLDDVNAIIEMQGDFVKELEDGNAKISIQGDSLIKRLFPLLSDIEGIEDLTDEEIMEVANNPSIAMLQASHAIEGIVTEVYKMTVLSARNRLLESDLALEDARMTNEMLAKMMGLAERDSKTKEKMDKIKNISEEIEKMQSEDISLKEEVISEEVAPQEKVSNITRIDKNANILASFKQAFDEPEE